MILKKTILTLLNTGPHPHSAEGHVFMMTVMDHFLKCAEAIMLRNHTAQHHPKVAVSNTFAVTNTVICHCKQFECVSQKLVPHFTQTHLCTVLCVPDTVS